MKKVVLYTMPHCPYCDAAKKLLNKKKVPYTEINIEDDDVKKVWLVRRSGLSTLPLLFVDNMSFGGFEEMQDLDKKKQLDDIIGAIKVRKKKHTL